MLDLIVSTEDVATELQLAATDVAIGLRIEARSPLPTAGPRAEAIFSLTDHLALDDAPEALPEELGLGLGATEQVAVLTEVKDKVAEIWDDFTAWRAAAFHTAKNKLQALAEKIFDTAKRLGVSVGHLLGRLQRRITAALVANSVSSSLAFGTDPELTFAPTQVRVKTVVKSAPALAALDVAGVVQLLSGLLSLELSVDVKYEAKK